MLPRMLQLTRVAPASGTSRSSPSAVVPKSGKQSQHAAREPFHEALGKLFQCCRPSAGTQTAP